MNFLEELIAQVVNGRPAPRPAGGLRVGEPIGGASATVTIPHRKRAEHIAVLGRTGSGKSSLLRYWMEQDIEADRGFIHFDLHGETTRALLQAIAAKEERTGVDLSDRVVVVEPADPDYAVGVNVLRSTAGPHSFVQVAETTQLLKQRWHLDAFGARSEELLRNVLLVLAECDLTLVEVAPFLTDQLFRTRCLDRVRNSEARSYFTERYDSLSAAMQANWREAVINKVTTFTADPHFRHLIGQASPTVSMLDVLDRGLWMLLNLDKGRLGEHAVTLGGLILTPIKHALFARKARTLVSIYADEVQNLAAYDSGIDMLLSEARKFGVSIVSSNQFLDQLPLVMRAAILATGTQIAFQLSSGDSDRMANALGGGRYLQTLLKNLPPRHLVMKSGHHPWQHLVVPTVGTARGGWRELYERSRARWARRRSDVEAEIASRRPAHRPEEALHGWD